jgi:2',3'-cyclic-nucleotide 2'-phosphodiesterase (5'-nucleotidase family)
MAYILQTNRLLAYLALFIVVSCAPKVNHLASVDSQRYRLDESFAQEDKDIDQLISPYRNELDQKMNIVIAQSNEEIFKEKPNSPLLNFMADALLEAARKVHEKEVDLAVQNYGGIRVSSLPKGQITIRNIYELMPFENTLVILEVKGPIIKNLFDRIAAYGGWPISEGCHFKIINDAYADEIVINGKPYDQNATYTIALPDYIANGGDKAGEFESLNRYETGLLIRDLIIEQLKQSGTLEINHEIRIFDEK